MLRHTFNRLQLNQAGPVLILGLALILPFESKHPLVHLGFAQITNVEFVLYLVIIAWGWRFLKGAWRNWTISHSAILAWALVIFLSAVFAPCERDSAFKFALRSFGGCMLFFAAADLSRTSRQIERYLLALMTGACISAAAGCVEVSWRAGSGIFSVFKTQASVIGGYMRASGTFGYANIAAMYWEALAPVCLIFVLISELRDRCGPRTYIFFMATTLILEAVLLSLSRAAVMLAILIPLACLGLARIVAPIQRKIIFASLSAPAILVLGHALFSESFLLRVNTPNESNWYRVEYAGNFGPKTVAPGEEFALDLKLCNRGAITWSFKGEHPAALSYHWENPQSGSILVWNGLRSRLPNDVKPGAEANVRAQIRAPELQGLYALRLDMVHEDVTWFSTQGSPMPRILVEIRSPDSPAAESAPIPQPFPAVPQKPDRMDLWRAAFKIWQEHPLLGVGPDNFRLVYGSYIGQKDFDNRIHSNSLYLETLANLGLLGILALAAVTVSLGKMLWRCWSQAKDAELRLMVLGLAGALAAFYLHGFVDYFLEFTPTYGLFWLVAGMATGLAQSEAVS